MAKIRFTVTRTDDKFFHPVYGPTQMYLAITEDGNPCKLGVAFILIDSADRAAAVELERKGLRSTPAAYSRLADGDSVVMPVTITDGRTDDAPHTLMDDEN